MTKKAAYSTEQKKYKKILEFFSGADLNNFLLYAKDGKCSHVQLSLIETSPHLSKFNNEILNQKYAIFIETLASLTAFMLLNFIRSDHPRGDYEMVPKEMRIPNTNTSAEFFFKEKIELPALVIEVEDAYRDFNGAAWDILIANTLPQEKTLTPAGANLTSQKLGIGFLTINGQEINLGQAKNTAFKLLESLSPFGTPKAVDAVYRTTTTGQSKHKVESFSLSEKKRILRSRIKELQDIFNKQKVNRKEKIKVMLDFNDEAGTVCLKQK